MDLAFPSTALLGYTVPMPKALSQEQNVAICEQYKTGKSPTELAPLFGVHLNAIYGVLHRRNVPIRGVERKKLYDSEPMVEKMVQLYEQGLSLVEVGKRVGLGPTMVHKRLKTAGVTFRPQFYQHGEKHLGWKGGRHVNTHGYVMIHVHADHPYFPMAVLKLDNAGYILEHRLVMAKALGRLLTEDETVHHKDGNKKNNHPDNLQLRRGNHGKGAALRCGDCGSCNIVGVSLPDPC